MIINRKTSNIIKAPIILIVVVLKYFIFLVPALCFSTIINRGQIKDDTTKEIISCSDW